MSTALIPAYDFNKAVATLQNDTATDLGTLLADLAAAPTPAPAKPAASPVASRVTDVLMRAVRKLPVTFGSVPPPASRRALYSTELDKLRDEKLAIDDALKALNARKKEIHEMVSSHFDVVAEKTGRASEETPRDSKDHYLLAAPGTPEIETIPGSGHYWTRERTSDTTVFSDATVHELYEAGKISRADYLACTEPVRGRRLSEEKLRRMLLSKTRRERACRLIELVTEFKRGTNSINLRGK